MAQISGSPSWALQLLFEVCFVSFSLKETLYRKITVINNEDTLTNNLEIYNHLRKGLIVPQCATGEAVWSESPSCQCLCLAVTHTAIHGSGGQGLGLLCCFCSLNSESWEQNPTDLEEKEQRTESNRKGCTRSLWSPSSHTWPESKHTMSWMLLIIWWCQMVMAKNFNVHCLIYCPHNPTKWAW